MKPIRRKGFTLIELLVVIAIIAILAAILFPVFVSAKAKANASQCISNHGQLGKAIMGYCDDNNGRFPYQKPNPPKSSDPADQTQPGYVDYWQTTEISNWAGDIAKYLKNRGAFRCPSPTFGSPGPDKAKQSYCGNGLLFEQALPQSAIVRPSRTIVLHGGVFNWRGSPVHPNMGASRFGAPVQWSRTYVYGQPCVSHSGGHNCLYADGHVKWNALETLVANPAWWAPDGKLWY